MFGEPCDLTINLSKRHGTVCAPDELNDCIGDAACLFL